MRLLALVGVALVAAAACGGPEKVNQDAMTAAPAASAASSGIEVVPFESLQALLPNLPGWTRGVPSGETDTVQSVSRVTVDYDKPPSTLSFELMDSSMNEAVLALIKEAIKGENPELKPTTLAAFPAAEQWFDEPQRGAIHVLVGGRFMLVVTGESVSGLDTIREAAAAIDLNKLAALK
jgi:hypothetical protein